MGKKRVLTPRGILRILEKQAKAVKGGPDHPYYTTPHIDDVVNGDWDKINISGMNLAGLSITNCGLELRGTAANLSGAHIVGKRRMELHLETSDLSAMRAFNADLVGSQFLGCDLRMSAFDGVDLEDVEFKECDLYGARFDNCNLSHVSFKGCNLEGVAFYKNNGMYHDMDLSDTTGVRTAREYLERFERDSLGYIVYKGFGGTLYSASDRWEIAPGKFLTETVNPDPAVECGCGVNFATREWIATHLTAHEVWKCRIRFEDLADVVVPWRTDGKARCARLELLEKLPYYV